MMQQWEYRSLTIRVGTDSGKMPGYFARGQTSRGIEENSMQQLNTLGAEGWELVSVLLLELGTIDAGPNYACAMLKRPRPPAPA
ncbi:MAG: hypothetical protein O3B24_08205 [Verrucomicrobia bacterium]|nr:hypothetical protein [Verrucomicrobiota bacterium]